MAMTMTGDVTLARRSAEGLGAAQRPGGAQGLHPGLRVAGEDRRQRLRRRGQDQDRAGLRHLQRQGRALRPRHRWWATPSRARARAASLASPRAEQKCRSPTRPAARCCITTSKRNVGGKIAQLGARLIDGVAKNMADKFFANFAAIAAAPRRQAAAEPAAPSIAAAAPAVNRRPPPRRPSRLPRGAAPQAIPTKTSWFRRISEWFMSLWR